MPTEQDFLPFAAGSSANVLTQAQYAVLGALTNGFSSGVAQSNAVNKALRQSSIMAAVLAQFVVDQSGQPAIDDGTIATLEANLITAIRNATKTSVILNDTGAINAYAAVNVPPLVAGAWVNGVVQQIKVANTNNGASTYAPDGLPAIPIYGLGLQPLQGGELFLNGTAVLMKQTIAGINSGNPIAVLMECFGGAQQIAPATQSNHAVQLGQFTKSLASNGYQKLPSGLIIQWGSSTYAGNSDTFQTFSFPISFPNVALSITGTIGAALSNAALGFQIASATQYQVGYHSASGAAATSTAYAWMAVGY
jgi:hypothetical protein